MPYAEPLLPVLEQAILTLQPEPGWGWHTHLHGTADECDPPEEPILLEFDRWVHAGPGVVGFYARPLSPVNGQTFEWVLCLLHTSEHIDEGTAPHPVSVQFSQSCIRTEDDPETPTGTRPLWLPEEAGLSGFGTLRWMPLPGEGVGMTNDE